MLIEWVIAHKLEIIAVATSAYTILDIVARWTPTQIDDQWVANIKRLFGRR